MRSYDFSPLWRSTIGFDRLFDLAESAQRATEDNYPPYNIERLGEDSYQISLAVAGFSPYVLVGSQQLQARTAQDLVALLKGAPGRYNLATAGIGSGVHVAAELFRSLAQVQVELVHYRGGGPSVAALVSGEAHFGTPTMASSIGQVRGGALRAFAIVLSVASTVTGYAVGRVLGGVVVRTPATVPVAQPVGTR